MEAECFSPVGYPHHYVPPAREEVDCPPQLLVSQLDPGEEAGADAAAEVGVVLVGGAVSAHDLHDVLGGPDILPVTPTRALAVDGKVAAEHCPAPGAVDDPGRGAGEHGGRGVAEERAGVPQHGADAPLVA